MHFEWQALEPANRSIVPENNLRRPHHFGQHISEQRRAFLHRDGLNLHHEHVAKLIDYDTREIVRLAPDETSRRLRHPARHRPLHRGSEVRGVEYDPFPTQPAPKDLGAGIIDSSSEQPVVAIAAFHDFAVVFARERRVDLVDEHPRVPGQHTRPRVRTEFERR